MAGLNRSTIIANLPLPSPEIFAIPRLRKHQVKSKEKDTMRGLQDDHDADFLATTFLRTIWLFQLVVTSPIAAALGVSAFVRLLEVHGPIYDFVTSLCTALVAAAIVFIVIVQRRTFENGVSILVTLRFEALKSIFATALWVWLMVDAGVQPESYFNLKTPRLIAAACSSVLLFILFYPTVFYAAREAQMHAAGLRRFNRQDFNEHTPLVVRI